MKRRVLTQEIVMNTAVRMSAETGLSSLTLSKLARELDIKPQSIYRYAADIDALRAGVIARILENIVSELYHILLPYSGKEALRELAVYMVITADKSLPMTDLGTLSAYRQHPIVNPQLTAFRQLITNLMKPMTKDSDMLRINVQLLIDVIFGQIISGPVGQNEDIAAAQSDFIKNLDRLMSLF